MILDTGSVAKIARSIAIKQALKILTELKLRTAVRPSALSFVHFRDISLRDKGIDAIGECNKKTTLDY